MAELGLFAQAIINGVMKGGIYALLAAGGTMVYAVSHIFNFAHGEFMALSMYGCFVFFAYLGVEPYLSMLIMIPLLFGIGYLLFVFVFRRVLEIYFLMTVQLTLGMIFIIQSILMVVFKSDTQTVDSFASTLVWNVGPVSFWGPLVIGLIVATLVLGMLYWMIAKTDFGRAIRALIQNRTAASLLGVNVASIQALVFAIGIALAALAGGLLSPVLAITPTMGLHLTLLTFIIMMLGGLGNFIGSLVAAIIIGLAESFSGIYIASEMGKAVPFAIFILILLFRREGLFGKGGA